METKTELKTLHDKSVSFVGKNLFHSESFLIREQKYSMQFRFDSDFIDKKQKEDLDMFFKATHDKKIKITVEVMN